MERPGKRKSMEQYLIANSEVCSSLVSEVTPFSVAGFDGFRIFFDLLSARNKQTAIKCLEKYYYYKNTARGTLLKYPNCWIVYFLCIESKSFILTA